MISVTVVVGQQLLERAEAERLVGHLGDQRGRGRSPAGSSRPARAQIRRSAVSTCGRMRRVVHLLAVDRGEVEVVEQLRWIRRRSATGNVAAAHARPAAPRRARRRVRADARCASRRSRRCALPTQRSPDPRAVGGVVLEAQPRRRVDARVPARDELGGEHHVAARVAADPHRPRRTAATVRRPPALSVTRA